MGLFNEFESVSHNEWLEKIITDLKGKDFDQNLVWKTDEEFDIQPIHHSESLKDNKSITYNLSNNNIGWEIREQINIGNSDETNKKALQALKGGANSLQFNGLINSQEEFNAILNGVMLEIISVHFCTSEPKKTALFLDKYISEKQLNKNNIDSSISYDYLGESIVNGRLYEPIIHDTILVNGFNYTNAGANATQELAYCLNQAVAYINTAIENKKPLEETIKSFKFSLGIGTNYFLEIAKVRAFKILWKMVTAEYGYKSTPKIHSQTSSYYLAHQDAATNILRTTTEAMSAVIGACNSLSVTPFNTSYEEANDFTLRVARNIQLLMQEEAYLNKVTDVAKGTYYIETLTDNLVESSLEKFKEIESKGGFIVNIQNDNIQNDIDAVHQKKLIDYKEKKRTLLGVNKHPNNNEEAKTPLTPNKNVQSNFKSLEPKNLAAEINE